MIHSQGTRYIPPSPLPFEQRGLKCQSINVLGSPEPPAPSLTAAVKKALQKGAGVTGKKKVWGGEKVNN